jgi:hypothetical protein
VSSDRNVLAALTTYKTALVALLVVIAGIGLMWLSISWLDPYRELQALTSQLGGLLITTGGLAIL